MVYSLTVIIFFNANESIMQKRLPHMQADVGGQRCPDSPRVYCTVSVRLNLIFSVGKVFECPDFEFELDFDWQTPHSKSRQNPDSAVRRRLHASALFHNFEIIIKHEF